MARLVKLKINESSFFEDMEISFSEKLNCIMGGRGTGKTTLLWLINSALGAEVESNKGVYNLLKSNLGEGTIELEIENESGDIILLTKVLGDKTTCVEVETGKSISLDKVREELAIDFYKSSSIESIGLDGESRLNLIDKVLGSEIQDFKRNLEIEKIGLSESEKNIERLQFELLKVEEKIEENSDVKTLIEEHKKKLPSDADTKINESFKEENDKQQLRLHEREFVSELIIRTNEFQESLEDALRESENLRGFADSFSTSLNQKQVKEIQDSINKVISSASEKISKSVEEIKACSDKNIETKAGLLALHDEQESEFVSLKQQMKKNREYFQQLNYLTKKDTELQLALKKKAEIEEKIEGQFNSRKELIKDLDSLADKLFEARLKKIKDINSKLGSDIRVTLERGGVKKPFELKFKEVLSNLGLRYTKQLSALIEEFSPSALSEAIQKEDFENVSSLTRIDKSRIESVFTTIKNNNLHFEFDSIYCPDLPKFFLKVDRKDEEGNLIKENFRDTEELSTGQRCTALLPIIFAASENPLVIDQPEDNLDNRYITHSIHELLRDNKILRQLVFVTHNPNIPVISESEYNLFLDYKNKKSHKLSEGNLEKVKIDILNLLEGGEEAFTVRKDIYGY
ncbi:AAA family ATPase [Halobacteriovorax sp.]|uniref:AAA family ATPase n=1 Tax=Halobacteriovorax sp. TaxID=2020862 RepID=UPI003AF234EC